VGLRVFTPRREMEPDVRAAWSERKARPETLAGLLAGGGPKAP
jgi:hypothetical protein